ncbi:hypothetical protein ACI68E_004321 [Malassezia pachydermatis]
MAFRRGDDDAGYSWATMVMEGMVPAANKELEVAQAEKATQTYSQLARKGHAQAQFGMGRLVLAKILSQKEPSSEPQHKQVQMAVDLWQRAGRNGYADAWFELGQLFHQGQLVPRDKSRALTYFEHGARGGSAMACHALGTLYLARAKKFVEQSAQAEASKNSALAARYFLQAAQKGHAASAYNVGLLYLLPPGADNNKETKEQHKIRHGVQPDDQNAREWFSAAASKSMYRRFSHYRLFTRYDELWRHVDGRPWHVRERHTRWRPGGGAACVPACRPTVPPDAGTCLLAHSGTASDSA